MNRAVIVDTQGWEVTSYGNGLAYAVKGPSVDLFFQGDDADAFKDDWEAIERVHPDMPVGLVLREACHPYVN